ncbi:hypothetical protein ACWIWK_06980 [Helicobacter sp. 23-1048]
MKTFSKIFVSLFVMVGIALTNLNALNFDEMMAQEFIAPSFDCSKAKYDDEGAICGDFSHIDSNANLALQDNFYSSYYRLVMKNIDSKDKPKIKQVSRDMIKNRRKCIDESMERIAKAHKEMEEEGMRGNPIHFEMAQSDCITDGYITAFRQITQFIYNIPAHKPIFEKIFYPNPKEYYESIMTKNKNYDFNALSDIIKKATNDNLVDKNGAFVGDSHNDSHESSENLKRGKK